MLGLLKTIIYAPLYNALVLILSINWVDAGLAAVILTILVKLLLYPLSKKSVITQLKLKEKEAELASIKEKYKDRQEQALKVMEFYRANDINPFSSILIILVQIPIIFSLYYIFYRSGLPQIDASLLYSFVKAPAEVSMNFLGLVDISQKSVILALLAAVTSFLQMHLASKSLVASQLSPKATAKPDFASMLNKQMKYTMPLVVFFFSWRISAIVALYWFVSNLLGIAQDWYIRKKVAHPTP